MREKCLSYSCCHYSNLLFSSFTEEIQKQTYSLYSLIHDLIVEKSRVIILLGGRMAQILAPHTQTVYFHVQLLTTCCFFQLLKRTKEEQEKWR